MIIGRQQTSIEICIYCLRAGIGTETFIGKIFPNTRNRNRNRVEIFYLKYKYCKFFLFIHRFIASRLDIRTSIQVPYFVQI